MARLRRAISIGGRCWDDVQRIGNPGRNLPSFDLLCACAQKTSCEQWFVSAGGYEKDRTEASRLARLWDGQAVALSGLTTHHVLGEAWLNDRLPQLLEQLLDIAGRPAR